MNLKQLYFLFFLPFFFIQISIAQSSVRVSGGRSFSNFSASIPEAGSDLDAIFTTSSDIINLSINSRGKYRISIRKEDTNWDNSLQMYLRRTGNGQGDKKSKPKGGKKFIQLTSFNQTFFEGKQERSNIPIQYEFRNISVLAPADGHTTRVVYTITSL